MGRVKELFHGLGATIAGYPIMYMLGAAALQSEQLKPTGARTDQVLAVHNWALNSHHTIGPEFFADLLTYGGIMALIAGYAARPEPRNLLGRAAKNTELIAGAIAIRLLPAYILQMMTNFSEGSYQLPPGGIVTPICLAAVAFFTTVHALASLEQTRPSTRRSVPRQYTPPISTDSDGNEPLSYSLITMPDLEQQFYQDLEQNTVLYLNLPTQPGIEPDTAEKIAYIRAEQKALETLRSKFVYADSDSPIQSALARGVIQPEQVRKLMNRINDRDQKLRGQLFTLNAIPVIRNLAKLTGSQLSIADEIQLANANIGTQTTPTSEIADITNGLFDDIY